MKICSKYYKMVANLANN